MIRFAEPGLTEVCRMLPGKAGTEGDGAWLPAWRHMLDTGLVMQRLLARWLPESERRLLQRGMTEEQTEQVAVLCALLHDIGKMTPVFAARLLRVLPDMGSRLAGLGLPVQRYEAIFDAGSSPHGLAGAAWLRTRGARVSLMAVIAAHHGRCASGLQEQMMKADPYPYGQHLYGAKGRQSPEAPLWEAARESWLRYALECCGFSTLSDVPPLSRAAQMVLTGLLIMADWIASNQTYFPLLAADAPVVAAVEEGRADAAMEALALPFPLMCDDPPLDAQRFSCRFGHGGEDFIPNALQQAVMDVARGVVEPGLLIIEAQMGQGKTEAALTAAEHFAQKTGAGGVYFGLPTQATANGVFPRLMSWAEQLSAEYQQAIRLAHGMAGMSQLFMDLPREPATDEEGLIVHPWLEGRKKALLSGFVIGTVDQLLMAALKQKHVMLRHLGLAGKVVIIDECHAYDAYMSVYLERALQWLGAYGTPVILLSATLPAAKRQALMDAYLAASPQGEWRTSHAYPLLTWSDGGMVRSRPVEAGQDSTRVQIGRAQHEDVPTVLQEALRQGGCAVVILNTVKGAQQMAERLRRHMPEKEVLLVHAHFMLEDRAAWEEKLLRRLGKRSTAVERDGLIVVATQVAEQSLDIDADIMITETCPMDLLLQRVGRLHRHARVRPEPLKQARCVVLPPERGAIRIYGEWLLQQTERLLPPAITLPQDIPRLVQDAYAEPSGELRAGNAWLAHEKKLAELAQTAKTFLLPGCEERRRENLNTINNMMNIDAADDELHGDATVRDGKPTVEVIMLVQHGDGSVGLIPRNGDAPRYDPTREPAYADAMRIARQRIRLPSALCHRVGELIGDLEERTRRSLPEWQHARPLRGELFLLLDESRQVNLMGYCMRYDPENGLQYWKEERKDDG